MKRTGALTWVTVVGGVLCACDAQSVPTFEQRDSAGVRILQNLAPVWERGAGWTVGPTPTVRIGDESDPSQTFSNVAGVRWIGSGELVVADGGSNELRLFTPDGRLRKVLGGRGDGPGEFRELSATGPGPDGTLWAFDFALRRVTWLSASGELVRVSPLPAEPPVLHAVGALDDRRLVLRQLWGTPSGPRTLGLARDPAAWVTVDPDGLTLDTLFLAPGRLVAVTQEGGRAVMNTPLFTRTAEGTARGERIVIGTQDGLRFDEWTADGAWTTSIRLPEPDLAVDAEALERALERRLEDVTRGERARLETALRALPRPERRPAHGRLLLDSTGALWIEHWDASGRWWIVDPEGRWLGELELPAGLQLSDANADAVVGVQRDGLGVESVVVYPLTRVPRR